MAKSLLKTSGRKKRTVRTPKFFDEKYYGPEPKWSSDKEANGSDISNAYNWYNYFYNTKEKIKLLFDHYPRDKKEIRFLKRLPDWKINSTCCYQARMMALGCKLPESSKKYFNDSIDALLKEAKAIREVKKEETKDKPVVSIQDRIREQISDYIAEIESEVDQCMLNNYTSDFNMYKWLQQHNVKAMQSNAIAEYYKSWHAELLEAKEGKCDQLKEGYSHMKKAELNKFIDFMNGIITDASTWGSNQKTVRKTRKKKPMSVEKQVSRLKYLNENKDYKLVSINPAEIIGSNQLWIFNVKYRKLTVFNAMGPSGFSIKGTTILGYDPENSVTKTLRKPEEALPKVLSGGKRVLSKLMDEINSKGSEPNGRINGDTILLRVIK